MSVALPSSWTEAPIGTLCVNTEQVTPDAEAEFIYVDIASVDRETKKITSPQRMLGKDAPSRARKLIKTGDTIVSTTRPNLNAVALVDQTLDGQIASTGFDVLRAPGLDPRWLGYLVRTSAFVDAMSSLVQGALYPAIRGKDVRSFAAPIAPANEQKRIADKLDTVLTRVDAVNTRLARVAPLLKRFRQSVLAAATSGRLTEDWRGTDTSSAQTEMKLGDENWKIPNAWHVIELSQAIDSKRPLCYGVVQPGEAREGGVPLIRVQDMENGAVLVNELRTVTTEVDNDFRRSRVKPGDILVSVVGTIGRTAIVPDGFEGNIARAIARVSCKQGVNPRWLNYWLNSPSVQWWLVSSSKEVARKTLNLGDLASLGCPIPQDAEQTEIVRRVETLFAFADRLEARLTQAQTAATRLTPSLLAKAFRGELVPQDPNDEPATELLRRLMSSNETKGSTKRKQKKSN